MFNWGCGVFYIKIIIVLPSMACLFNPLIAKSFTRPLYAAILATLAGTLSLHVMFLIDLPFSRS